jgi:hypothetical protein
VLSSLKEIAGASPCAARSFWNLLYKEMTTMDILDLDIHLRRDPTSVAQLLLPEETALPDAFTSIEAVEQFVYRRGFEWLRQVLKALLEDKDEQWAAARQHQEPTCQVTHDGTRGLVLKTVLGEVKIDRQQQYCHTHEGRFLPFNQALGLEVGNVYLTQGLVELAALAILTHPYVPAKRWVDRMTHSRDLLCAKEVQRLVVAHGQAIRQREKEQAECLQQAEVLQIQDRMWRSPPPPARTGVLYLGVDGIMIRAQPGRHQWLTGYVGAVFTPAKERVSKGRFRLTEKHYVTSFESLEDFGLRLQGAARLLHWENYAELRWLVDGARELIHLAQTHSPRDGRLVIRLDWYHLSKKVKQRLGTAYPENPARRKAIQTVNTLLWNGKGAKALAAVAALQPDPQAGPAGPEALDRLREYLQRNLPYMAHYRAEQKVGYMISSAQGEKPCDVVVAKRMKKKQGMHWGKTGADAVAACGHSSATRSGRSIGPR